MKSTDIIRMYELTQSIATLSAELETLKEQARQEANGNPLTLVADNVSVVVSKAGKPTETLDTKAFQIKAPKLYAECFAKYKKTGSPRAASVKVTKAE